MPRIITKPAVFATGSHAAMTSPHIGKLVPAKMVDGQLYILADKLAELVNALNHIASWPEGSEVSSSFDEPASARTAREALHHFYE